MPAVHLTPQAITYLHHLAWRDPNPSPQRTDAIRSLHLEHGRTEHTPDVLSQTARQIGPQVNDAVKLSYATSITRIYVYAFWLAIVALVAVTLWLPEIPLRKSNRTEMPPAFE